MNKLPRTCCLLHMMEDISGANGPPKLPSFKDVLNDTINVAMKFTLIVHKRQIDISFKRHIGDVLNQELMVYVTDNLSIGKDTNGYPSEFLSKLSLRVRDIVERELGMRDENFEIIKGIVI